MYKTQIWNKKGQFGAQARKVDAKVKVGYSTVSTLPAKAVKEKINVAEEHSHCQSTTTR